MSHCYSCWCYHRLDLLNSLSHSPLFPCLPASLHLSISPSLPLSISLSLFPCLPPHSLAASLSLHVSKWYQRTFVWGRSILSIIPSHSCVGSHGTVRCTNLFTRQHSTYWLMISIYCCAAVIRVLTSVFDPCTILLPVVNSALMQEMGNPGKRAKYQHGLWLVCIESNDWPMSEARDEWWAHNKETMRHCAITSVTAQSLAVNKSQCKQHRYRWHNTDTGGTTQIQVAQHRYRWSQ